MVNVDSVYQRVLALANKEQRGYITPQEFILFANQAQLEIVDQYFYDLNQFERTRNSSSEFSDMVDLIEEKLGTLATFIDYPTPSNNHLIPSSCYRLNVVDRSGIIAEKVTKSEFIQMVNGGPLTSPTNRNPVYMHEPITAGTIDSSIHLHPAGPCSMKYIKRPANINWGYVVVNEVALYDPTNTIHFELHPMEETELVYKILKLAGLAMRRDDVAQGGQGLESMKIQQEKQ